MESSGKLLRLSQGTIGNNHLLWLLFDQRLQNSAYRSARAKDQYPFIVQIPPQVVHVVNHADTIGVVTENAAVCLQCQSINRTRTLGAGRQLLREIKGILFERHGHIKPFATLLKKIGCALRKGIFRHQLLGVGHALSRLLGKMTMNMGRFTVVDRVAKNGVAISHYDSNLSSACVVMSLL